MWTIPLKQVVFTSFSKKIKQKPESTSQKTKLVKLTALSLKVEHRNCWIWDQKSGLMVSLLVLSFNFRKKNFPWTFGPLDPHLHPRRCPAESWLGPPFRPPGTGPGPPDSRWTGRCCCCPSCYVKADARARSNRRGGALMGSQFDTNRLRIFAQFNRGIQGYLRL